MKLKSPMIAFALCATAGVASADCFPELTAVNTATEIMLNACANDPTSRACGSATQQLDDVILAYERCVIRETNEQPIGG